MRGARWAVILLATTRLAHADDGATEPSTVIDRVSLFDVPGLGHLFDDRLGVAPGSQADGLGLAFSGSSSLENRYLVDGLDVTELRFGGVGATLPVELVDTIDIAAGGYGPAYGRATGAIVNVTTRRGTNELHGSVFAMISPGFLSAPAAQPPSTVYTPIASTSSLSYDAHAGFDLGGPIVRDHVWFYVGFAPTLAGTTINRTTQRQIDCEAVFAGGKLSHCDPNKFADGIPDVDPKTGAPIVEVLDRSELTSTRAAYTTLLRLDLAPSPDESGMIAFLATPRSSANPAIYGTAASGSATTQLTTDATARWTAKPRDGLELTAQLGWHHDSFEVGAFDASGNGRRQVLHDGTPFAPFGESQATIDGCADGDGDVFPNILNCPSSQPYTTGGPGRIEDDVQDRLSGRLAVTQRFTAAGSHAVTAGLEGDVERLSVASGFSGGRQIRDTIDTVRVELAPIGSTDPRFDQTCVNGANVFRCLIDPGIGSAITHQSNAWAAFVREVWQPRADLTLDAGLRYDTQHLDYGSDLQSATDPVTSPPYGDTHLSLGRVEPRLGIRFDPTGEGHAEVFAHWGRYAGSVPLNLNARALSDGALEGTQFQGTGNIAIPIPQGPTTIAPGVRGEYADELVVGARYELGLGFVVGATFRDRRLHDVVEDLFDGMHQVIGNPGETPSTVAYDRPTRDYDALELTVAHRFAKRLYVQASYTYARTLGDYAGAIDYDTGQVDPNISTQYDQFVSNANRRGALPQDRPHYFKLDAAYTLPLGACSALVLGTRFRALSGTPEDALGSVDLNPAETFLLPRGAVGRTPTASDLDVHVAYRHALGRATIEVFADVFNVLDGQAVYSTDSAYAVATNQGLFQSPNPVSGGTYADLIWVKTIDSTGAENPTPIARNPNFQHATSFYPPLSVQLGARVSF